MVIILKPTPDHLLFLPFTRSNWKCLQTERNPVILLKRIKPVRVPESGPLLVANCHSCNAHTHTHKHAHTRIQQKCKIN